MMQIDLTALIDVLTNATAIGVIIYWILDCLRNWRGSPDQKAFREARGQVHEEVKLLIEKLGKLE